MLAQRLYFLFMLILLFFSWRICQGAIREIEQARNTQAAQIERILAQE
jgi:TRAP-type C4-dicarboxylate transport system permease small subunit